MMYRLEITAQARRELKTIQQLYEEEVSSALREIKEDPLTSKALVDELKGRYSYRIDVYRIIYTINRKDKVISVLSAGHRSTIYKKR